MNSKTTKIFSFASKATEKISIPEKNLVPLVRPVDLHLPVIDPMDLELDRSSKIVQTNYYQWTNKLNAAKFLRVQFHLRHNQTRRSRSREMLLLLMSAHTYLCALVPHNKDPRIRTTSCVRILEVRLAWYSFPIGSRRERFGLPFVHRHEEDTRKRREQAWKRIEWKMYQLHWRKYF